MPAFFNFQKIIFSLLIGLLTVMAPMIHAEEVTSKEPTLVVWDFDNHVMGTATQIAQLSYLERALPELIITGLNQASTLRIVERMKLREILQELKLGSSKLSDEDSRLKLGKTLGAKYMVFGSYTMLGNMIRVDVRVIETETSLTLFADAAMGTPESILNQTQKFVNEIREKIGMTTEVAEKNALNQTELWAEYDKGILLMEKGKYEDAIQIFQTVLKKSPDFSPAEKQMKAALNKLSRQ